MVLSTLLSGFLSSVDHAGVATCLRDRGIPLHLCTPTLPLCLTPSQRQSRCVLHSPVPERLPALLHLLLLQPEKQQPCGNEFAASRVSMITCGTTYHPAGLNPYTRNKQGTLFTASCISQVCCTDDDVCHCICLVCFICAFGLVNVNVWQRKPCHHA